MRYTEKEYLKIGQELNLLISQACIVGSLIAGSFPIKHRLYSIVNQAIPAPCLNETLFEFKHEFKNWYSRDFPNAKPAVSLSYSPGKHDDQTPCLEGVPNELSSQFFTIQNEKKMQTTQKKPGLNRLELIVSILFFHHVGNRIAHFAMSAIERNFPAKNATSLALEYLDSIRKLIEVLQKELAILETKGVIA